MSETLTASGPTGAYNGFVITPRDDGQFNMRAIGGNGATMLVKSPELAREWADKLNKQTAERLRAQIKREIDAGRLTIYDILGPTVLERLDEDGWRDEPPALDVNPFDSADAQLEQAQSKYYDDHFRIKQ